jgi:hypothetical protein
MSFESNDIEEINAAPDALRATRAHCSAHQNNSSADEQLSGQDLEFDAPLEAESSARFRASDQPQTIPCRGSNKQEDLVVLVQSIGARLIHSGHQRSTTTVSGLPCLQTNVE